MSLGIEIGKGLGEKLDTMVGSIEGLAERIMEKTLPKAEVVTISEWQQQVTGPSSGSSLGVRSGDFRRRIRRMGKGVVGTDHVAARIHEYGGVIVPVTAKALVFQIDGQWIQVQRVVMPARPHRDPAIEASSKKIEKVAAEVAQREIDAMSKGLEWQGLGGG